jgi:hypothetical protein
MPGGDKVRISLLFPTLAKTVNKFGFPFLYTLHHFLLMKERVGTQSQAVTVVHLHVAEYHFQRALTYAEAWRVDEVTMTIQLDPSLSGETWRPGRVRSVRVSVGFWR